MIVYLNIDTVIRIIRKEDDAAAVLRKRFRLSKEQVEAILEIRLRQLAKIQEIKIRAEQEALEPEENEQLVARFLEINPDWHLIDERTLHPVEDHTDGTYAARLTQQTGV